MTAMSPYKQARAIFRAIKNDPVAIKLKRTQYAELVAGITGEDGGMQITDANVNGQNFTARHSSTAEDRMEVLSLVISMLDCNSAGSTTMTGGFR